MVSQLVREEMATEGKKGNRWAAALTGRLADPSEKEGGRRTAGGN